MSSSPNGSCSGTGSTSFISSSSCASGCPEGIAVAEAFLSAADDNGEVKKATITGGRSPGSTSKSGNIKRFFTKYFLQGQQYNDELHEEEEVPSEMAKRVEELLERYRKYIGFLIPCLFMQLVWWTLAVRYNIFWRYQTHYELPLTMVLGATVVCNLSYRTLLHFNDDRKPKLRRE